MCFYLFAGIILFIIFLKHFQKVFDECYREKVDSGMAFFSFSDAVMVNIEKDVSIAHIMWT